jgi:peptidyl-prolyl cis-trans isomerase C
LPKFEDVKAQIQQQMQQERLSKFQDDLRSKAKVE